MKPEHREPVLPDWYLEQLLEEQGFSTAKEAREALERLQDEFEHRMEEN
jgi:hypothetical protein